MSTRGAATRERLLDATRRVVREVGYAHATTRAIASAAGVSEGTIYRHFPDKRSLFFAAVLDGNAATLDELTSLPERAGQASVTDNLAGALARLASLRDDIVPLELALMTDPQMADPAVVDPSAPAPGESLPGPPGSVVEYLAAEQRLGRVRPDLDPQFATVVLFTLLFGMSLRPTAFGADGDALAKAVRLVVTGIATEPDA